MKAIKITFISALTEVNAYKLKRGYEWGVGKWKGLCIAMYSCPMDTRALRKRDWVAAALSIIYFAIFLQATMKVCFFFWRQARRAEQSTVILGTRRTTLDRNVWHESFVGG